MKTPNYQLALAISEAGWSNHETARRINARATKNGHSGIATSSTRVSRWIRHGEKPRHPVPDILAELLTEGLRRTYTPESLNISPPLRLVVLLGQEDHQALAARAATQNLSLERYAHKVLRSHLN
ncbi:hypothetical protein ACIOD0_33450 [Kitasatospora albolonga]